MLKNIIVPFKKLFLTVLRTNEVNGIHFNSLFQNVQLGKTKSEKQGEGDMSLGTAAAFSIRDL